MPDEELGIGNHLSDDDVTAGSPDHNRRAPQSDSLEAAVASPINHSEAAPLPEAWESRRSRTEGYDSDDEPQGTEQATEVAEEVGEAAVSSEVSAPTRIEVTSDEAEEQEEPEKQKEHTDEDKWDPTKSEAIGTAINNTLYREDAYPGSIKGHPAETIFRGNHEDSLEDLYDLNPERFAQMPTHEFITLSHEFGQINNTIESTKEALAKAQQRKEDFVKKYDLSTGPEHHPV